jgi:hypothetical protein
MARRAWIAYARIADIDRNALKAMLGGLSFAERQRHGRFATARRKREFLAARWLLARLRRRAGLLRPGRASLSHSGGWVACALVQSGLPGIDIEPMVARDFAKLGEWAFPTGSDEAWSPNEEDLRAAFYGRWTRYEARWKAPGKGRTALTWFIDGVALSAYLPTATAVHGPLRWRKSGRFVAKPGPPATRSSS